MLGDTTAYLGPIPDYIDPNVFYTTLYTMFDLQAPKVSGNMESHTDYEVYGKYAYFWNDCVYAPVQDAHWGKPGGYQGWFSEELPRRFAWLRDNWKSIYKEE